MAAPSASPRRTDGAGAARLHAVRKVFRARSGDLVALSDVSLDVDDGTFVSLIGPSGCGKSTLLKVLAGLIPASSGSVELGGAAVREPSRSVGLMFQTPVLFPWRTVLDNVLLPIEVFRLRRQDWEARARQLLALVGLGGFERALPHELSGGMQQRVALARLLIFDPRVLLMDEPFGALDEFTRERLNLELATLWERDRPTVFFVTHNISEAVFLSDRVVVMGTRPGRVLDVLDVDLPRPRARTLMQQPQFVEQVFRVRDALGSA